MIQARILPRFSNREIKGQELPLANERHIILITNLCRKKTMSEQCEHLGLLMKWKPSSKLAGRLSKPSLRACVHCLGLLNMTELATTSRMETLSISDVSGWQSCMLIFVSPFWGYYVFNNKNDCCPIHIYWPVKLELWALWAEFHTQFLFLPCMQHAPYVSQLPLVLVEINSQCVTHGSQKVLNPERKRFLKFVALTIKGWHLEPSTVMQHQTSSSFQHSAACLQPRNKWSICN